MEEIWKDIPDYEGLYQISDLGNLKSLNFNRSGKEGKIKQSLSRDGYLKVTLYKNKIAQTKKPHQLVAMAFLNHIPCGYELVVNHKNFIKTDNRLENLEIVTTRENTNLKHIESASKYTGVHWCNTSKKWRARVIVYGKEKLLGRFNNELEASNYYENAVFAIKNGQEIRIKAKEKSSKYKGVSWNKKSHKWSAKIYIRGKSRYIGSYNTELEAHEAIENTFKLQIE